jgi:hypothetical protein
LRCISDSSRSVAIYGTPKDVTYAVPRQAKAEQRLANAIAQRFATTTAMTT